MTFTPDKIVGIIIAFGLAQIIILMFLKRMGIIKIGNSSQCSDHKSFCKSFREVKKSFKTVRDEHLLQGQTIEQHSKELDEGKIVFNDIKKNVAQININIALIKRELKIEDD